MGYIPDSNRLYLGDKELNVVSFQLLLSVLEYQTAVMRRDFETADRVLPTIPKGQIISECPYEIIVSPIRPTKKFPMFLP